MMLIKEVLGDKGHVLSWTNLRSYRLTIFIKILQVREEDQHLFCGIIQIKLL